MVKKQILWASLTILLASLAFLPSLDSTFIYDDLGQIVQNEEIHNISDPKGVLFNGKRQKRIMQNFSFALDWHLSSGKPWTFHLQNIFWHALCCFLVFLILIRLFPKKTFVSFVGLGLFALHPLQHQSVVYIMGRITLLQAFFFLAALSLLLYRPRWTIRRNILIWISLFAKESCILLPFFIAIVDYLIQTSKKEKFYWRPHLIATTGVLLLSPILFFAFEGIPDMYRNVVGLHLYPFWKYVFTQGYYFLFHFFLFLNPAYQSIIHQMPPFSNYILASGIVGISIFLGTSFFLWKERKKYLPWTILWVLFIFQLAPTNTVLQMINPFAEYRIYLGTLFICVAVAFLLDKILKKQLTGGIILTSVLSLYFLYFNYLHQQTWKHIFTAYDYALSLYPNSISLNYSIGLEYYVRNKFEHAEKYLLKTIEIQKKNRGFGYRRMLPYQVLAQIYTQRKEYKKALDIIHPITPGNSGDLFPVHFYGLKMFLYKKFKDDKGLEYTRKWAELHHPNVFKE